uniref:Uncharacterized protein n=1 Tax=Pseudictyota dubia TaxID=2749911 RepID=A0A7R9VBD6_9STRA
MAESAMEEGKGRKGATHISATATTTAAGNTGLSPRRSSSHFSPSSSFDSSSSRPLSSPGRTKRERQGTAGNGGGGGDGGLSPKALIFMALLALQFGIQPLLFQRYTSKRVIKSSVVLCGEVLKFTVAGLFYWGGSTNAQRRSDRQDWSIRTWLSVAGLPAALFTTQTYFLLLAVQNVDALTFNVLNQTKILSSALCCYLVMGQRQSRVQVLALILLMGSALVIEEVVTFKSVYGMPGGGSGALKQMEDMIPNDAPTVAEGAAISNATSTLWANGTLSNATTASAFNATQPNATELLESSFVRSAVADASRRLASHTNDPAADSDADDDDVDGTRHFTHGVLPVLLASFLSGLAGALAQRNLQGLSSPSSTSSPSSSGGGSSRKGKAALGSGSRPPRNPYMFTMELSVASAAFLLLSLPFSTDGRNMAQHGFFYQWTPYTCVPILTNSLGAVVVGLVTKHAGVVRKGFALIFGLLLSGILQVESGEGVSAEQFAGGALASLSLWLHTTNAPSRREGGQKKPSQSQSSQSSKSSNGR